MASVAVVGLALMGSRFARRLLDAGHRVVVWNRTREKALPLVELGAAPAGSPADAARQVEADLRLKGPPDKMLVAARAVRLDAVGIQVGALGIEPRPTD